MKGILGGVVIALVLTIASVFYVTPVAMSFYAARKAVPITRVVPVELRDRTISQIHGMQLAYAGYDFEVPWDDLDESTTQLYPKNNVAKTMAVLAFRWGLRIMVTSFGPRESAGVWDGGIQASRPEYRGYYWPRFIRL